MPAFSHSAYPLFYSVPTDCRSIHIGLSVPSYPHRKRDQKGQLPGLQKAHWGLRPDKPQQGLASACSSVDRVSKTREFGEHSGNHLLGGPDRAGQGRGTRRRMWGMPSWLRPLGPSALLPQQTSPCSESPFSQAEPLSSLVTLRPPLWHIPPWFHGLILRIISCF